MVTLDLPEWVEHIPADTPIHLLDYYYLLHVLRVHDGNRSRAARAVHLSLRTIRNKLHELKALGFEVPEARRGISTGGERKPRARPALIVRR